MKLGDLPKGGGSSLQFGYNPMTLSSFVVDDGQYGKQVKVEFTKEGMDKPKITWIPTQGAFTKDKAWMFGNKVAQLADVLSLVHEDGKAALKELEANMREFNNEDDDDVHAVHAELISAVLKQVLGKTVNVIFHYSGEYLNIPKPNENNYNLPFGNNPVMGANLNSRKATPQPVVESNSEVENNTTPEETEW